MKSSLLIWIWKGYCEKYDRKNDYALRDTGKQAEADKLVASWKKDFPESKPAQWCAAVYHGNMDQARELLSSRYASNETTPWETGYRDTNFDLIARLFSEVPR